MNRNLAIALALVLGVVAIAVPLVIALGLARERSAESQMASMALLAEDVLRRSDESGDQIAVAFAALESTDEADPCAPANIALMARLALGSSHLQALGFVAGDQLRCSSFGSFAAGAAIGPPDYVSVRGLAYRTSVRLAGVSGRYLMTTRAGSGYTAIFHRDLPLDVFVDKPYISLGLVQASRGRMILQRGEFLPQWFDRLGTAAQADFVDAAHVVSIRRSPRYDVAAYAAGPAESIEEGLPQAARVLVPIGALAGLGLALAVLFVTRQQLAMPAMMRMALRRKEFFVEYQPIVNLETGEWAGAEALVRWRRANGEMVRPDLFIPVAEESGLIQRLTEHILQCVARDSAGLFEAHPAFHIAVNLSSEDLHSEQVVELLSQLARTARAPAGGIWAEATERGFLNPEVVRDIVRQLRRAGVPVGVDDFGTGYSSLSSLGSFELDFLKIDKSFVDTLGTGAATSEVALHIIEMAKSLNLRTIAEGVETREQARFLRERGVDYAQGWLYAKALPMAELRQKLARGRPIETAAGPSGKTS